MRVLVTGGAGYVGSFVVAELVDRGASLVVMDDLSTGHRASVPSGVPFVEGDIGDRALLEKTLRDHRVEAIVHMAASCLVGESMTDPEGYYRNNVTAGLCLLEAARASGVDKIVFSSSAAAYGAPDQAPIDEDAPLMPVNPYGETKRIFESALQWHHEAYGTRSVSLRYFNAAGAAADLGEDHHPETHLIPILMKVALGKLEQVEVFGDDYPTPDGTCLRDYVHVADLARAHVLALDAPDKRAQVFNLGSGKTSSVLEVIQAAREATGHAIPAKTSLRRPGDPAVLLASHDRITGQLGWRPEQSDLPGIIGSAWAWHRDHPEGYTDE